MKVGGIGPTGTPSARRTERSADGGGGFARSLRAAMDGPATTSAEATSASAGLDGLLALQAVEMDPEEGRERARRRGLRRAEEMLDELEAVRHGLLTGAVPKDRLAKLAATVRAKRDQGVDPQLAAILDEIELRAEVELAKLVRAA